MDSKELDFEGLARVLLQQARLLIPAWLPGGAMRGHEYVCSNLRGGPGGSFSVNVETGKWADFADSNLKGGDLISLYAAIEGLGQGDAAKALAEKLNYPLMPEKKKPAARGPEIAHPPEGMPEPAMHHGHFGDKTMSWTYRDRDGRVMFYIARYDPEEGKQFVPWCWDAKEKSWVKKSWPLPRPVYGLDLLEKEPGKPVLVVEGEKAADAARALTEVYLVVSWPGGASGWRQVDWTALKGRKVLLWPDADRHTAKTEGQADKGKVKVGDVLPYDMQPGPAAMVGIAGMLHGHAEEIKIIDVGFELDRKDGWDAADAVAAGWSWNDFADWAKPRVKVFGPAVVEGQVIQPGSPEAEPGEVGELAGKSLYKEWERLGIVTNSNGSPICNVDNALRVIQGRAELKELLWYDVFHQRYLTKLNTSTWAMGDAREWRDVDELNLTAFMQRNLGLRRMGDEMVHKAAIIYANRNVRCEPRDWLSALKWDGSGRCDSFFIDCFGAAETDYVRAVSKNFWIGMVARIFWPGCQLDNMVVLEGAQGIGKTKSLRAIGGPWYTEVKEAVTSREFFMVLHGRLVVEIAELDSFSKAEVTRIKQVVTCCTDRYRAPYERGAQDHPRMSIFVGTTNESTYLRDGTGGRRFWPIKCGEVDLEKIASAREQLFAEAVARYKAGETWYETPASMTMQEQEDRRMSDEWEDIIAEYLADKMEITTRAVADHLKIEVSKMDMVCQKRIAGVLRTLGWEKHYPKESGRSRRVWRKAELPFAEAPVSLIQSP